MSIPPDRSDRRPPDEPPGQPSGMPAPESQGRAAALPVAGIDAETPDAPMSPPQSAAARATGPERREATPPTIAPAEFEATIEALVRAGSPGAVLRQARLMRRLSIADVATTTRIRSEYVTAMEDGTGGVLPPGRYGLSLYRSYAIFLGVPPDDIVRMYDMEAGRRSRSVGIFGARVSVQSSRRLVGAVVVAAAIALAGALWYYLQPLGAAEIDAATARVLAQATFLPGVTASGTRTAAIPTVALSSIAPTVAPTAVPPRPTAVPPTSVPPTPTAASSPTPEPAAAESDAEAEAEAPDPSVVVLTVIEDSWLRITVDGKQVFEGIVSARDTRTLNGDVVSIVAGNAAGVDLVAYGDRIGVVGKRNEVFEGVYRRPSR